MTARAAAAVAAVAAVALAGCSSTRDKAKKVAAAGNAAFQAKGLRLSTTNASVRVISRSLLTDENGTAAILGLRNVGARPLGDVPISVTVADTAGKPVYRNDAPGLETSLTAARRLDPGKTVLWVDDQVQPAGTPKRVAARVGRARPARGAAGAPLDVGTPKLTGDATSGIEAVGMVKNTTGVVQSSVVVTAVARKGSRVVAAGRAIVTKVAPGKSARYAIFFIGDPRGARLEVAAPATAPSS